ncbi:uncharacterized protein LOC133196969 [Saccostrea echinata]|uniref:uncharacterized protein LOC133196969 n=1 Tax=Saccostrea echinata TaxID=191078 RepID=UPI002A80DF50|nr:uncharacterized protein LOC133196969 [Saccostrea echinata]
MDASKQKFRGNYLVYCLILGVIISKVNSLHVDKSKSSRIPDFGSIANSFSQAVEKILKDALSMFHGLPSNYRNSTSEILHKNGTSILKNITIIKNSTNSSLNGVYLERTELLENKASSTMWFLQFVETYND